MYLNEINGEGGIYAKMVADSVANDIRLSTLELCYPRFIHSEFMTHRQFSRNASSSRAIPVAKMLDQVRINPAMPIHWGKNKPGMQAEEEVDKPDHAQEWWKYAAEHAGNHAESMSNLLGLHKQVTNRILEPYQFIKVVVTATEWDNFFQLRLDPAAQPEIQELARCMKECMDGSVPISLRAGQYHLPYVGTTWATAGTWNDEIDIKLSVARCARVSYLNHDKTEPNVKKDVELYDMLLKMWHMSPFEHVATPMTRTVMDWGSSDQDFENGVTHMDKHDEFWSGNFRGWAQHRQVIMDEKEGS